MQRNGGGRARWRCTGGSGKGIDVLGKSRSQFRGVAERGAVCESGRTPKRVRDAVKNYTTTLRESYKTHGWFIVVMQCVQKLERAC